MLLSHLLQEVLQHTHTHTHLLFQTPSLLFVRVHVGRDGWW